MNKFRHLHPLMNRVMALPGPSRPDAPQRRALAWANKPPTGGAQECARRQAFAKKMTIRLLGLEGS